MQYTSRMYLHAAILPVQTVLRDHPSKASKCYSHWLISGKIGCAEAGGSETYAVCFWITEICLPCSHLQGSYRCHWYLRPHFPAAACPQMRPLSSSAFSKPVQPLDQVNPKTALVSLKVDTAAPGKNRW